MEPIIKVDNLTHTYSAGTPFERNAVEHISFEAYPGEFIGVIGHRLQEVYFHSTP